MDNSKYKFSDLELLRQKLQLISKIIKVGFISFFVGIFAVMLLMIVNFNLGTYLLLILFMLVPVMIILGAKIDPKIRKEYETAYKEILVIPTLAEKFDRYTYSVDGKVTINDIKNLGIWNKKQESFRVHTEDFLTGTYQGVYYEQTDADICCRLSRTSDKETVVFNGTISKFRFNKKISGRLVLAHGSLGGTFSAGGLPQIKTENTEFNNKFTIHSEDGHDAFYVLTPHFMEYLMKLYNTLPGTMYTSKTLVVIFENDTVTILRGGVRMFELSAARKVDFYEAKGNITREMRDMLEIVNILKIGTPESKSQEAVENNIAGNSNAANEEIQDNDDRPVAKFRLK